MAQAQILACATDSEPAHPRWGAMLATEAHRGCVSRQVLVLGAVEHCSAHRGHPARPRTALQGCGLLQQLPARGVRPCLHSPAAE